MSPQRLYLDLLRKAVTNELHLDTDARLLYLFTTIYLGEKFDPEVLRNIRTRQPEMVAKLSANREQGLPWWMVTFKNADGREKVVSFRNFCDYTHSMIGVKRMRNIEECLDRVREENIPGDLAECGVWRGGAAIFMRGYLAAYDMRDRVVWAADSFEGIPVPSHAEDLGYDFSKSVVPILAISLEDVQELFARYGLLDDQVLFLKGWFSETLPSAPIQSLALLRLDGDLYESTRDALRALYDKVVPGGFVIVDDYGDFPPCRKAVDEFRGERAIASPIVAIDWSGAYWRKP